MKQSGRVCVFKHRSTWSFVESIKMWYQESCRIKIAMAPDKFPVSSAAGKCEMEEVSSALSGVLVFFVEPLGDVRERCLDARVLLLLKR